MAHWEENGFATEWAYDQHRLRGRSRSLNDGQLIGIVAKHGKVAFDELTTLAASGKYARYADALPILLHAFGPGNSHA
jgi:hypothetical protein